MIGKSDRIKLKRILKNEWIADVLEKLSEKQILNKKGKPYEKTYISKVFNGDNSNEEIEKAIFEVYAEKKLKQTNLRVYKQNLLEIKKA